MLFFSIDGYLFPITNMYDVDGDETTNPESACSLVAMLPDGLWLASQCEPSDIAKVMPN